MRQCDEGKPCCGACRKVGKRCEYSYGRAKVIVLEDPTQFSGHGRAKVRPVVFPIKEDLELGARVCPILQDEKRGARAEPVLKKDASHDGQIVSESRIAGRTSPGFDFPAAMSLGGLHSFQIWSPEEVLRARFNAVLGCYLLRHSPFVIDSLWAEGIPARIGCSRTFDLAVQAAIDSFNCFQNDTYSTRKTAMVSRGKALSVLRQDLEDASLSFDLAQAIRMHFYSEVRAVSPLSRTRLIIVRCFWTLPIGPFTTST